jgi:hypothetical protein
MFDFFLSKIAFFPFHFSRRYYLYVNPFATANELLFAIARSASSCHVTDKQDKHEYQSKSSSRRGFTTTRVHIPQCCPHAAPLGEYRAISGRGYHLGPLAPTYTSDRSPNAHAYSFFLRRKVDPNYPSCHRLRQPDHSHLYPFISANTSAV